MKTNIILLFILYGILNMDINAQSSGDNNSTIGSIIIAVSNPKIPEGLDDIQGEKIKNRIIRSVNRNSISAVSVNSDFTIQSSLQLLDEESVDGLRNRVIINSEIHLRIEQKGTKNVFSSYSKKINGIGSNRESAINNAIKSISFDGSKFKSFIDKGKKEIVGYYTSNCDQIISSINAEYNKGNYKQAIILSASIPAEIEDCFARAQEIAAQSYFAYRNTYCKELILKGKSALANDDFKLAGVYFSHVDPRSSCYEEAKALLNQVNTEFAQSLQQQQEYDFEVLQLFAVTQILTEYYGNANTNNNSFANNQHYNNLSNTDPNIFVVIVADTEDEGIGKSTQKDMVSMSNLFRKASKEIEVMGYSENKLYANTFDKKNILKTINSLPVKNDDVLIFYYSGHGLNETNKGSLFPTMALDGDDLLLEELHQIIKNKNARLTLTIGDLCNSIPRAKVEIETDKESVHKSSILFDKEKLKKLFLQSSGDIISTSSRKGQWSFCSRNKDGSMGNGQFTNAFLNMFSSATTKNDQRSLPTEWSSIFENSYQQALRETKRIKNQDGSLGQAGYNSININ